jgi:hypothetical protein
VQVGGELRGRRRTKLSVERQKGQKIRKRQKKRVNIPETKETVEVTKERNKSESLGDTVYGHTVTGGWRIGPKGAISCIRNGM